MEKRRKTLSKELKVIMSKKLAEGRYHMTLAERRLLYVAMSKISSLDNDFREVIFTKGEFLQLLKDCNISIDSGRFENELQEACINLLKRVVEIKTDEAWEAFTWLSKATYEYKTQKVILRFNDGMKPYLLFMLENKGYTKFLLKFALPLTSSYSARLYEEVRGSVSDYLPKTRRSFSIDELREVLMIEPGKYKRYNDLKRWVLKQATKEINEKTDILIYMREKKSSRNKRKVEGMTLTIELKKIGYEVAWQNYKIWSEDDLDEAIFTFIEKSIGQKIEVPRDFPDDELRLNAKARVLFELKNGYYDLATIKYAGGFIRSMIDRYAQDELALNQLSLADTLKGNA